VSWVEGIVHDEPSKKGLAVNDSKPGPSTNEVQAMVDRMKEAVGAIADSQRLTVNDLAKNLPASPGISISPHIIRDHKLDVARDQLSATKQMHETMGQLVDLTQANINLAAQSIANSKASDRFSRTIAFLSLGLALIATAAAIIALFKT
jgi:hypothetical protein